LFRAIFFVGKNFNDFIFLSAACAKLQHEVLHIALKIVVQIILQTV